MQGIQLNQGLKLGGLTAPRTAAPAGAAASVASTSTTARDQRVGGSAPAGGQAAQVADPIVAAELRLANAYDADPHTFAMKLAAASLNELVQTVAG